MSDKEADIDYSQLNAIAHELTNGIPTSWINTTLGVPLIWGSGGTPKSTDPGYYGGPIPWLVIGDLNDGFVSDSSTKITELGLVNSSAKLVEPGTILLAMYGSIGKMGIASVPLATNQAIAFTKPDGIVGKYLFYFLQFAKRNLASLGKGATQKNISQTVIKAFPFVLAPYVEQQRIVTKIEELLSELDKAVENLRTAQQQLKVYRQALLKNAFEGKLTADWRAQNTDKQEPADALLARIQQEREARYQQQLQDWRTAQKAWEANGKAGSKPSKPKAPKVLPPLTAEELAELPELPLGWAWGRLGYMTCGVEYGTAAKSSAVGRVAVLRMGNIQNSRFDWEDLVYTDDSDEIAKYSLRHNDVLFNRTNSPELVGKSAIYRSEQPALFAGYLIRINQISSIAHAQFLNLFLGSHVAKQHGNRVKTDGVNQSNINGDKLVNYPFPFCHQLEQEAAITVLEGKLSLLDQLEQTITHSLQQADALRQSILKKAFSGQLVPQDLNDEPASVLLERIRAERAAQPRARGRKAKASV